MRESGTCGVKGQKGRVKKCWDLATETLSVSSCSAAVSLMAFIAGR